MIMKEIDQRMLDSTEFNIEMLDKKKCKKIIGFYEARKLDVLSILSNPFKHQFNDKSMFVLLIKILFKYQTLLKLLTFHSSFTGRAFIYTGKFRAGTYIYC